MHKARVLLISPPTAPVSTEVLLNLAYLASYLRARGHEVKVVDATAPYKSVGEDGINRIAADFRPHFIGVTLTITNIPQSYLYLKKLKELGIPIVAGGPHPNSLPEEVLDNGADIVAIGEGEETAAELAEHFSGGRQLKDIAGLAFKDGGGVFFTPKRKLIGDIDTIPFPDFSDFPISNYTGSNRPDSNPIFWSIFTSRGCPFNCTFCASHNVFGRVARMRSARNVFEEMRGLVEKFGAPSIAFQDDEILCSKKRVMELCGLILDAGLKIKMSIRTRIDSIDRDILVTLKAAGVTRISFGIESWNDETLRNVNKKYTVSKIHEKFRLIEETRFPYVSFNNICGFPWETKRHFDSNLREISRVPRKIAFFTAVLTPTPFPRTQLYDAYHKQYGFTGWWLKAENPLAIKEQDRPFFLNFASQILSLYWPNGFWKYSSSQKKDIESFSWQVFGLFMKRQFRFPLNEVLIALSKISYRLWLFSPALEKTLFRLFPQRALLPLKERISFTSKY